MTRWRLRFMLITAMASLALLAGCAHDNSLSQPNNSKPAAGTSAPGTDANQATSSPANTGTAVPTQTEESSAGKTNKTEPAEPEAVKTTGDAPKTVPSEAEKPKAPEPTPKPKDQSAAAAPKVETQPQVVTPAQPKSEEKAPVIADAAEKAEPLFKNNCLVCHGDQLQGGVGPNISKVGARRTKEQLIEKIKGGGKIMPPFKDTLKQEEIETLAAWLVSKK